MQQLEAMRSAANSRILVLLEENITLLASKIDSDTKNIVQTLVIEHNETRRAHLTQHSDEVRHHAEMMTVLYSIRDQLSTMVDGSANKAGGSNVPVAYDERRILEWLRFDSMYDRRDTVSEAHRKTFEWILDDDASTREARWTNLKHWLESGSGVYWISGKAGSGKSTLMKFISDDHRVKEFVATWAGQTRLVLASFYFWSNGTNLQKSLEGLFQALLYEILNSQKELICVAYPADEAPKSVGVPPTLPGLKRAFNNLMRHTPKSVKYCFMIDGLDEYKGDGMAMTELAEFFKDLCSQDNVKAVVASRPTQSFHCAFENGAKMALHDLTYDDLHLYVRDKVECHEHFLTLQTEHSGRAESLSASIVEKAAGVFLWVKLVIRSLLEGLQNHESLTELEETLETLPPDLEQLYEHMLNTLSPKYRSRACQFLLAVATLNTTELRTPYYAPESFSTRSTALNLSFISLDNKALLDIPIREMPRAEVTQRHEEVETLVRSRCQGLLVTRRNHWYDWHQGPKIEFLHKSVSDYIKRPIVWQKLEALSGASFQPDVAVMRLLIAQLKCNEYSLHYSTIEAVFFHNRNAEEHTNQAQEALLDEMDRVMSQDSRQLKDGHDKPIDKAYWALTVMSLLFSEKLHRNEKHAFLLLAIYARATKYVLKKLKAANTLPHTHGKPLLFHALHVTSVGIVEALLDRGANPNEIYEVRSPLRYLFAGLSTHVRWTGEHGFSIRDCLGCATSLIRGGADPTSKVKNRARFRSEPRGSIETYIRNNILNLKRNKSFPPEIFPAAEELIGLVKAKSAEWKLRKAAAALAQDDVVQPEVAGQLQEIDDTILPIYSRRKTL